MRSFLRYINLLAQMPLANKLIYGLYEKFLLRQIKGGSMPHHIALILDGNRRWASTRGIPAWLGHRAGAEKVEEFLRWSRELGMKTVTLYVFSTENFHRDKREVDELFKIAKEKLQALLRAKEIHQHRVRIKALGRIELMPAEVRDLMREVEEATKDYEDFYLNIAIAYGGRAEIADAMRKIAEEVRKGNISPEEIDESAIERYLYTSHLPKPDPDLIIRTSGEERLSNFLLWQSAYSELLFFDVYWPDFRKIDLLRAIRTYQRRRRRYGL